MTKLSNTIITKLGAVALLFTSVSLVDAQVQRYNATSDNGYGVVYNLPKTEYLITATVLHKHFTPGELAPWAAKYLGKQAEIQAKDQYELLDIRVETLGVADTNKRYLVPFDKKSIAPFVMLTADGVLYSINGNQAPKTYEKYKAPSYPQADRNLPAFPREYALATSQSKRADIAATYLYELREHAMSIVSGEVEQMPKDGESMRLILDQLKGEERRTLRLFDGDTTYRTSTHTFRIVPEQEEIDKRLLFRFAPQYGIVAADDLSGDPVYLNLRFIEKAPQLDPKELKKREESDGIVYNLPGLAELSISTQGKTWLKERVPITQIGTIQSLSKKMLNLKEAGATAIYLDPRSGALERITTE